MKSQKKINKAARKKAQHQRKVMEKKRKMKEALQLPTVMKDTKNEEGCWDDIPTARDESQPEAPSNSLKQKSHLSRKQAMRKERGMEKGLNIALAQAEKLKGKLGRRKERHKNRSDLW